MTKISTGNSRRTFLRHAGMTLAAGLGVAVATTLPAQASVSFTCCPSTCRTCPSGKRAFNCVNSSTCRYCTLCSTRSASCYNTTQPSCP